jgi:hypothetical protein
VAERGTVAAWLRGERDRVKGARGGDSPDWFRRLLFQREPEDIESALVALLSDAEQRGYADAARVARDIAKESAGYREEFSRGANEVAAVIEARAADVARGAR